MYTHSRARYHEFNDNSRTKRTRLSRVKTAARWKGAFVQFYLGWRTNVPKRPIIGVATAPAYR